MFTVRGTLPLNLPVEITWDDGRIIPAEMQTRLEDLMRRHKDRGEATISCYMQSVPLDLTQELCAWALCLELFNGGMTLVAGELSTLIPTDPGCVNYPESE